MKRFEINLYGGLISCRSHNQCYCDSAYTVIIFVIQMHGIEYCDSFVPVSIMDAL